MNLELEKEITRLGGSVTDPVWYWLVNRGPHGINFTWSQTSGLSQGLVGAERLLRRINEKQAEAPEFISRLLEIFKTALQSDHELILLKAIQIGAVLGTKHEVEIIREFINHDSELISKHAKAATFHLKKLL